MYLQQFRTVHTQLNLFKFNKTFKMGKEVKVMLVAKGPPPKWSDVAFTLVFAFAWWKQVFSDSGLCTMKYCSIFAAHLFIESLVCKFIDKTGTRQKRSIVTP